jgi:hypothetical protein
MHQPLFGLISQKGSFLRDERRRLKAAGCERIFNEKARGYAKPLIVC